MKFTKMHGCGNDYIYINGFTEHIDAGRKPELVRQLSDRHFGIGGDGVIFINPGKCAAFEMEMYNADGTRAQMCGNGIRCVAKYVYDYGLTDQTSITIESFGSVKYLDLTLGSDGKVSTVRVNMGAPILKAAEIPVVSKNEQVVSEEIKVNGQVYKMTCVSMGNPHAVVFVDGVSDMASFDIEKIGPCFETHERFPERTNTEFVRIIDKNNVQMRVWERGTGETLACGTGCCATAVACVLNGLTDTRVTVQVPGGEILCEWDRQNHLVYMTGPAVTVFDGVFEDRFDDEVTIQEEM
ncbi:MAG: diaminopimelate epimerase [Lachnospiraceae bacterium]|nr:diaminopimelate epimerase [Lachnospiraceae bacterium]MDE7274653.1 diaminopimelate epimerase [Lachnospiraceae bacterium]